MGIYLSSIVMILLKYLYVTNDYLYTIFESLVALVYMMLLYYKNWRYCLLHFQHNYFALSQTS